MYIFFSIDLEKPRRYTSAPRWHVTPAEFETVSGYLKGRISLDKVINGCISLDKVIKGCPGRWL
jgi:hypothetical protein